MITRGRVGHDQADGHAGAAVQRFAQPPGGLVGVFGQQHHGSRGRVGLIHAGRGEDQAVPRLGDGGGAAPRDYPHRLGLDRLLAGDGDHPALGLAHDLGGDHQDVTVTQVRGGVGDEPRQIAARGDLRQPGNRDDGEDAGPGGTTPPKPPPVTGGLPAPPSPPGPPYPPGPACHACSRERSRARSRAARAMAVVAGRSRM